MKEVIKQILKTNKQNLIVIGSHINSDPDAICSSVALAIGLKNLGYKNVKVLLNESGKLLFNKMQIFISNVEYSQDASLIANLFCVCDLNSLNRLGEFSETFNNAKRKIVIDHHIGLELECNASYSIPDYSSTCELVFNILNKLKALNKMCASALYIGMRADTGAFKFGVEQSTLIAASKCLSYGLDTKKIISFMDNKITESEFSVISKAYSKIPCNNGLKIVILNESELIKNNIFVDTAKQKAISMFSNIDGIKVLCILINFKNKVGGSFRSYCKVNVAELASLFGGGGHIEASGFENESLNLENIIDQIKNYYNKNV